MQDHLVYIEVKHRNFAIFSSKKVIYLTGHFYGILSALRLVAVTDLRQNRKTQEKY